MGKKQVEPGEPICEKCGYVAKSAAGLYSHNKVCGKRPTDEELLEMRQEEGMSYVTMGRILDVSETTVRNWLRSICDNGGRNYGGPPPPPSIKVYPEYAPLLGENQRCVNRFGEPLCPFNPYCWAFLNMGLWVMCEAPTKTELQLAVEVGFDVETHIRKLEEYLEQRLKEESHARTEKQEGTSTCEGG